MDRVDPRLRDMFPPLLGPDQVGLGVLHTGNASACVAACLRSSNAVPLPRRVSSLVVVLSATGKGLPSRTFVHRGKGVGLLLAVSHDVLAATERHP